MYGRVMTDEPDHTCPYCKKNAAMVYVNGSARLVDEHVQRVEAAYQCYVCDRFVIGGAIHVGLTRGYNREEPWIQNRFIHRDSQPHELFDALDGIEQYWEPVSPVGKLYPDVLAEISGPADEAHRCYSIGAYRAAVLMARSVIEAAAKNKKVEGKTLYDKIEAMGEQQLLRPLHVASAHEIRFLGNDMAHGDFATADIAKDDALDVLVLMDEVLDEVFGTAERLKRRRERRSAEPESD